MAAAQRWPPLHAGVLVPVLQQAGRDSGGVSGRPLGPGEHVAEPSFGGQGLAGRGLGKGCLWEKGPQCEGSEVGRYVLCSGGSGEATAAGERGAEGAGADRKG